MHNTYSRKSSVSFWVSNCTHSMLCFASGSWQSIITQGFKNAVLFYGHCKAQWMINFMWLIQKKKKLASFAQSMEWKLVLWVKRKESASLERGSYRYPINKIVSQKMLPLSFHIMPCLQRYCFKVQTWGQLESECLLTKLSVHKGA